MMYSLFTLFSSYSETNMSTNNQTTNMTSPSGLTALLGDLEIVDGMKYVYLVQGSFIIIINLALVAFIALRKHVRKNQKNIFLASLFVSHSIIGVLCCLLSSKQTREVYQIYMMDYGSATMLASFCNLMLVTVDRFTAIRFPMFYNRITIKTVLVALIIVWLIPVAFLLLTLVVSGISYLAFVLVTFLGITILMLENLLIYCIVRKQVKNIKSVRVVSSNELLKDNQRLSMLTTNQASHHRAFFICLAMVLSYVIAWLPATVYVLYNLVTTHEKPTHRAYQNLIVFLAFSNSISDPIIYTWFNRKLKMRMKEFIQERSKARTQTQLFANEGRPRAQTQLSVMEN